MRKAIITIILSLFSLHFSQAMEDSNDLHLIAGSARRAGKLNTWWEIVVGKEGNFSHENIFGGKATTLDILELNTQNLPHIVADARDYKPSPKIQSLYLELFPSIDVETVRMPGKDRDVEAEYKIMMLMPDALENLGQYMKPGSILEIEHIPHLTCLDYSGYLNLAPTLRPLNPFHCFFTPLFIQNLKARKLSEEQQISFWSAIKGNFPAELKALVDEAQSVQPYIHEAIKNIARLTKINVNKISERIDQEIKLCENNEQAIFQTISSFVQKYLYTSLIMCILQEECMLTHQDIMVAFLEKNGFTNIAVNRQDNPYNGRKNVWWISATHL